MDTQLRAGVIGVGALGRHHARLYKQNEKVKTKAKKKSYITGQHGSGAAKMKADYRRRRANRHKNG